MGPEEAGQQLPRPTIQGEEDLERIHSYHLDDHSIYKPHSHVEYNAPPPAEKDEHSRSPSISSGTLDEKSSGGPAGDDIDRDLEANDSNPHFKRIKSRPRTPPLEREPSRDPNVVSWDGPDDPANPKNWTFKSKWAATAVVSMFTFISPVSSTMVAPALTSIAKDLHITEELESSLTLSVFLLAYAFGPLILGPLSEVYGRVPVIQLSNLFFLAFNIGCGFAQTKGQMIAFRFFAGLGGSAPLSTGGGVLSDVWTADQRGRAIALYSLAPLLGPAVGPVSGGFIAENVSWRWVFWATSIVDAVIQVFGIFLLRETYAPKLLGTKAARLRAETGNQKLRSEYENPDRTIGKVLRTSLSRPFILLGTQPIVQCLAVYMAYLYGMMYLVLSTFPTLWEEVYHESVGIGGLNYISLGLGFFLASQICAPLNDKIYKRLKARNGGKGEPEFRVPLMVLGAAFTPIGLFWYGWSAQARVHWIVPNIGVCIFAAGVILGFQCVQTFLVDSYTRYAASAIGAATFLRSLAGFGFPLFAPYMYQKLDYGWGNSLLGFIAIAIGIPAPFLLWKFGAKLRARSQYAAGAQPK